MIFTMKLRNSIAALIVGLVLALPGAVRAEDNSDITHDARTEGFTPKAQVEKNSVALVWLLFIFLALVSMGVLFKDAKRSHLD